VIPSLSSTLEALAATLVSARHITDLCEEIEAAKWEAEEARRAYDCASYGLVYDGSPRCGTAWRRWVQAATAYRATVERNAALARQLVAILGTRNEGARA
jgi:hypothetical protein